MSYLDELTVRAFITKTNVPVVFRGHVAASWPICQWSPEKWSEIFGEREYPFRCVNKHVQLQEPCWERNCTVRKMTFQKFTDEAVSSEDAMYFDYKYLHEWFSEEDELCKIISWSQFGFPDKGPMDTTLWVGSEGAHTPAHQDTYGVNIVTQVYGKKRWILFPPESKSLQPTRVPYEESSVYSELNFFCPIDVKVFEDVTGARVVDLSAGDALVVPHRWWHYVQNEDPVNISLNMWLPHENDKAARMSEAVIKLFVAQLCKGLPPNDIKLLVNPTEDNLADTSLTELLTHLELTTIQCLDDNPKEHRRKRRKTSTDGCTSNSEELENNLKTLVNNPDNRIEIPETITSSELIRVLEETKNRYKVLKQQLEKADAPSANASIKDVINAFCQNNVVDPFKQNLLS